MTQVLGARNLADVTMAEMVCSGEAVESRSQVRERLGLEVTLNRVRVFCYRGFYKGCCGL